MKFEYKHNLDVQNAYEKAKLLLPTLQKKFGSSISKAEGNVDLLMPHVERQMKMVEGDNGKFEPQVVDAKDERRYKDIAAGTFMDANDLLAEMKESAAFAPCFKGTGSSGAGKRGSGDGDKKAASKDKAVKHIKHDDAAAVSANLEGIANGTVIVDLPDTGTTMMIQDG